MFMYSFAFCFSQAESEGKAFFDYKAVYDKRIENDWNNAISKQRFRKVIAKADDEGAAGLKEELQEVCVCVCV